MNDLLMPLLDIAIAHSSFQKHLGYTRVHLCINGNIAKFSLLKHEEKWVSFHKSLQNTRNLNFGLIPRKKSYPGFLVSAVATLEPKFFVQNKDKEKENNALSSSSESKSITIQTESSSEDSEELNEREKLRRIRISKANKGNTPWNKGRKHSPETVRRIREKTKLAMQSPKVKMKLATIGHAQSKETRIKIAVGVRLGWQRRREKLKIQERCVFDWQNLIADASRRGLKEEEELQWDSYDILTKQLQQEWLDSIEHRKSTPRPKGSKRAPKSLEQRKKIAESIAAKWADPEYRLKVVSGLAKYHGIPEGAERKVKKKPSGDQESTRTSRKKSTAERSATNNVDRRAQLQKKKRAVPKYKDPMANTKLEMLKSIRAQRVGSDLKKNEALERAKLLITEAKKAAKALEVAAMTSPVARATLIEAQKLIAEATQSIDSIENGELIHQDYNEKGKEPLSEYSDQNRHIEVNGIKDTLSANMNQIPHKSINGVDRSMKEQIDHQYPTPNGSLRLNGINGVKFQNHEEDADSDAKTVTKKWVRGRLVEVADGE